MTPSSSVSASPRLPRRLRRLASMLDERFRIPGTKIRFGYDSLLGLIPGVGDTITAAMSLYIVWQARKLGLATGAIVRMLGNIGIDWFVGLIPLVGDIFDVGFKANLRNLELIDRELASDRSRQRMPSRSPRTGPLLTSG